MSDQPPEQVGRPPDLAPASPNASDATAVAHGEHANAVAGGNAGIIASGHGAVNVQHLYPPQKVKGMAIAALVLGLCGFLLLPIPLAIIFGVLALIRANKLPAGAVSGTTRQPAPPNGPASTVQPAVSEPGAAAHQPISPAPGGAAHQGQTGGQLPLTDHSVPDAVSAAQSSSVPVGPHFPTPHPAPGMAGPHLDANTGASAALKVSAGSALTVSKTVSLVAAILGLVSAGLWAIAWTVVAVYAAQVYTASGCEVAPGYANVCTLKPGDCFIQPSSIREIKDVRLTPCDQAHDAQAIGAYSEPTGPWPGFDKYTTDSETRCPTIDDKNVDSSQIVETDQLGFLGPNSPTWNAGYHNVICIVGAGSRQWTRSVLVPGADLSIPTG